MNEFASPTPTTHLDYKLTNVVVTSFDTSGANVADEHLTLGYQKIPVRY